MLVISYRKKDALVARDTLAKSLYGALFDWIVLQLNYSLIPVKEKLKEKRITSIGQYAVDNVILII